MHVMKEGQFAHAEHLNSGFGEPAAGDVEAHMPSNKSQVSSEGMRNGADTAWEEARETCTGKRQEPAERSKEREPHEAKSELVEPTPGLLTGKTPPDEGHTAEDKCTTQEKLERAHGRAQAEIEEDEAAVDKLVQQRATPQRSGQPNAPQVTAPTLQQQDEGRSKLSENKAKQSEVTGSSGKELKIIHKDLVVSDGEQKLANAVDQQVVPGQSSSAKGEDVISHRAIPTEPKEDMVRKDAAEDNKPLNKLPSASTLTGHSVPQLSGDKTQSGQSNGRKAGHSPYPEPLGTGHTARKKTVSAQDSPTSGRAGGASNISRPLAANHSSRATHVGRDISVQGTPVRQVYRLTDNTVLVLGRGDITKWNVNGETDAIVNAANEACLGGGGVDGAIHRAAGWELREWCKQLPEVKWNVRCRTGDAVVTPAARLPVKYVIHTVGPIYRSWERTGCQQALGSAYMNSLRRAKECQLQYICFCAISCGIYGYPVKDAAKVSITVLKQGASKCSDLKEVHFMLFEQETWDAYTKEAQQTLESIDLPTGDDRAQPQPRVESHVSSFPPATADVSTESSEAQRSGGMLDWLTRGWSDKKPAELSPLISTQAKSGNGSPEENLDGGKAEGDPMKGTSPEAVGTKVVEESASEDLGQKSDGVLSGVLDAPPSQTAPHLLDADVQPAVPESPNLSNGGVGNAGETHPNVALPQESPSASTTTFLVASELTATGAQVLKEQASATASSAVTMVSVAPQGSPAAAAAMQVALAAIDALGGAGEASGAAKTALAVAAADAGKSVSSNMTGAADAAAATGKHASLASADPLGFPKETAVMAEDRLTENEARARQEQ